jgi:hypothetical protein
MFVGGLAIVRAHNHWARDWTVLVTLSGWFFLALGLFRMFAAGLYQRGSQSTSAGVFCVLDGPDARRCELRRIGYDWVARGWSTTHGG